MSRFALPSVRPRGAGSDIVTAGAGDDTVIGTADGVNDTYNGGADTDTIDYRHCC